MGETGAPLFEEAFANLECRMVGKMEAGDHTVYLGRSPPHTSDVLPISSPTSTPPWSTEDNQHAPALGFRRSAFQGFSSNSSALKVLVRIAE
jgi:hypothetical protein